MLLSAKTGRVRETTPLRRLSHKFEEMKNRVIIHRLHCLDNVRMISKLLTDNEIIIDEISVQGEDLETYFENLIGGRKNV